MRPFNTKQTTRLLMNAVYMIKEYCDVDDEVAQLDKDLAIDILQEILSLQEENFAIRGIDLDEDKANGTLLPF